MQINSYLYFTWYYDPVIGRFINADDTAVLGTEQGTVLQYNLYAYCHNNPVNLIDPSGYIPINPVGMLIGGAVGAVAGVLLAKLLGLSGWKKGLFIAGCTVAGAILGNFLAPYMTKLLALAKAKIAAASTIIASSWQQAEQLLRKAMNSVQSAAARTLSTPLGNRICDALNVGARKIGESKYGYQGLSQFIKTEIGKDSYLISKGYTVEWHFYWSQVSNSGGPSGPLRQALQQAGIKIVEHFKR